MKLVSLELLTGGTCACRPAVHQRQQVASKTTLICVAHEDLLRVFGVHGNLTSAAVVTLATERAIETNLLAAAMNVERDAALGRGLSERGVRLKLIDVQITGPWQGVWGERKTMVRWFPTHDKPIDSVGQGRGVAAIT